MLKEKYDCECGHWWDGLRGRRCIDIFKIIINKIIFELLSNTYLHDIVLEAPYNIYFHDTP